LCAFRGGEDGCQLWTGIVAPRDRSARKFDVSLNDQQQIVEIVSHSTRELADGLQLLRLLQQCC
jgi:hypothetical protein